MLLVDSLYVLYAGLSRFLHCGRKLPHDSGGRWGTYLAASLPLHSTLPCRFQQHSLFTHAF